jgi:hypothetical protein
MSPGDQSAKYFEDAVRRASSLGFQGSWTTSDAVPASLPPAREAALVLAPWTDAHGEEQAARELLAEAGLTMIGKHASDKATAKAARRAAYKASTRRAARP